MFKKILFALCSLYSVSSSAQYVFERVDVNPGPNPSNLILLGTMGSNIYFSADDGVHGIEPWISDGTVAGTKLLKDVNPGAGSSSPFSFAVLNSKAYFFASDGTNGNELWATDGTATGTQLLKDMNPGAGSSNGEYLTTTNGKLFFRATNGTTGLEPWISDGTVAGTFMLKDLRTGTQGSTPYGFHSIGTNTFFSATDGTTGQEVWVTDGTTAGTQLLKDICAGSCTGGTMQDAIVYGSKILFSANEPVSGTELYITDGTITGTQILKDISAAYNSNPQEFTPLGSKVYFSAASGTSATQYNDRELWMTDGTAAGTQRVIDIWTGNASSRPESLIVSNNKIFFKATDSLHGEEVWVSDGTTAGTRMVKDVHAKPTGSASVQMLTDYKNKVFFTALDTIGPGPIPSYSRRRLYVSDGTDTGTKYIQPSGPGITVDDMESLKYTPTFNTRFGVANNCMFFRATYDTTGLELWIVRDTSTTTPPPGNVHTTTKQNSFKMYPNPAAHSVNISFYEKHNDAQLIIADITGKVILQRKIEDTENDISVDIAGIANGVYITIMQEQNRTETTRLIIQQ